MSKEKEPIIEEEILTEEETTEVSEGDASQKRDSPNVEDLQKELGDLKDQHLRLMAEYDNFKKRTLREKQDLFRVAEFDAILKLLPIFDNLERGLESTTSDENVRKGIEMIYNQGQEVLKKMGIQEIDALGKPFDPELYNAVMHIEDPNEAQNVVTEVLQKGYEKDGKVIRHAMVKVVN